MAQRVFPVGTRVTFNHKTTEPFYGSVIEPWFEGCNTVVWDDKERFPHPISYQMGEVRKAVNERLETV